LPVTVVHPSGILGPYDLGRNHLVALLKDFSDGKLTAAVKGGYDFVDVRDVVDGILKLFKAEKAANAISFRLGL
jgi:dihydroflavonol-4-reductase